jgi:Na+/melibiose symporter-like transporter
MQQHFGRIDPFCLFAVLPLVVIAGLVFWGGIAILGVILTFLAIGILVGDSWANRPSGSRAAGRYRDDY